VVREHLRDQVRSDIGRTLMFDAQLLVAKATTPYTVLSPWFPRGGDYIRITAEMIDHYSGGTPSLVISVQTKNSEDPGDGNGAPATGSAITPCAPLADFAENGLAARRISTVLR